jgi:3-oxoacyl-[acyl-carrier-protein] synthase-3
MISSFKNLKISAIQSVVPSNVLDLHSLSTLFGENEVDRIIKKTGIRQIRVAEPGCTSSDLCFKSAELLLEKMEMSPKDIDGLVFVSQTRDYLLPQTSSILQHRLGLGINTICFDLPLGCSGYIYGLLQASMMISSGVCKKVLLLSGDTTTRLLKETDHTTRMVFGDAGTATLIEKGDDEFLFKLINDGSGAENLIIPSSGFRKFETEYYKDSKLKDFQNCLYMDGLEIFEFVNSMVPKFIDSFIYDIGWKKSDIDLYLFHQANLFIVETIRKRLKLEKIKVPIIVEKVGNTGPSSIPLLITMMNQEKNINEKRDNIVMCGFGVGLSCGACSTSLTNTNIFNLEEK